MMRLSIFLTILLLTTQGSAQQKVTRNKAVPTQDITSLASASNFIFRGTVKKLGDSTLAVVPASAQTDIVHVDEVLDGAQTLGDFTGQDITVELRRPQSVKEGQALVFFSNVVAYGSSIAVREVNHLDAAEFGPNGPRQVAEVVRGRPDRELRQRFVQADLVVTGRVLSFRSAGEEGRPPSSEHDPQWWQAEVVVKSTEKGKAPADKILVYVPHSDDIRWFRAPKLMVGQEGVFLLRRSSIPELQLEGFTVVSSLDVQPIEERERIRTLLKKP